MNKENAHRGNNMEIDTTMLEDSICRNCANRISRIYVPFDFENLGFTEEELEEIIRMAEEDNIPTIIEEHVCSVLHDQLDYLVVQCNKFKEMGTENLINPKFFAT